MKMALSTLAFAGAICVASPVGVFAAPVGGVAIKHAAAEIGLTENVHCRPFRHWHRWGYGRGCARGAAIINDGVRVRSRFGVRARGDVDVRSRDRIGVGVRSGTSRDGAAIRGGIDRRGTSGSVESRGSISGGQPREGMSGGIRGEGGAMRTAPAGQGTQGGAGTGAGSGAGSR